MNCEICGKEAPLFKTAIENTELAVCKECSNFGKVIEQKKLEHPKQKKPVTQSEEIIELIVQDYGEKIKRAREELNLKQEEFAQKIAEKESVIQNIESSHIKLIEQHKEEHKNVKLNFKDSSMTIGDLVNLKKE